MRALIAALAAVLIVAPAATLAEPALSISIPVGAHPRNDDARCVNPVRIGMYAAQGSDALTAGAAAEHGAISRTPFGASPALAYVAEQGALDLVVGVLMRRANCAQKNLIDAAIGASALSNAVQNRSTR